jgi:hypothetical protein
MRSIIRGGTMTSKKKYPQWTLIDWDGNPNLGYKCWRKSFHNGHVSVGVGDEFDSIVYSYGANSDHSMSSTRARSAYGRSPQTEEAAMNLVDGDDGRHERHEDDTSAFDAKALEAAKKLVSEIQLDERVDDATFRLANAIRDELSKLTGGEDCFRYACRLIVLLEASAKKA